MAPLLDQAIAPASNGTSKNSTQTNGRRLLPHIIDERALFDPNRLFFVLTESISKHQTREVTYKDLSCAVNRAAKFLDGFLGPSRGASNVAFVSRNACDLRYFIMVAAGMKTGHIMLLASPRNSIDNYCHLLRSASIKVLFSDINLNGVVEASGVKLVVPPSIDHLLAPGPHEHYPYHRTYDDAKRDVAFMLHSSGSTGPPKIVAWTHGKIGALDRYISQPSQGGGRRIIDLYQSPGPHFSTLPFFHSAGFSFGFVYNILHGEAHTSLPASAMPIASNVAQFLKTYQPTSLFAAPSVLEDIAADQNFLDSMRCLKFVTFGGALIADHSAKVINEYVPLFADCGTTESSVYPCYVPLEKDAVNYFYWPPHLAGAEFREEDGLFELVFKQNDTMDWAIFHQYPELSEYATKDLYQKHPKLPHHWKLVARTDDLLVLSNGEKVVPTVIESVLRRNAVVSQALVVGHGQFMTAALLELDANAVSGQNRNQIIELIRPTIDEANQLSPGHARISLDRILFTKKEKPMVRAAKGNVLRKQTVDSYKHEIEALYSDLHSGDVDAIDIRIVADLDEHETQHNLVQLIAKLASKQLSVDQDFFQAGLDSGNVLALVRNLRSILRAEMHRDLELSPSIIYSNPTVKALSSALRNLAFGQSPAHGKSRGTQIQDMIRKYGQLTTCDKENAGPTSDPSRKTVLITGTTGSLGSYLLHELINDPKTTQIYALNRSDQAEARQSQSNHSKGLSTDFTKVTFLQASLDQPQLGLNPNQHHKLASQVDLVIHNAWPVNFNQPLPSFEPHIAGVRHLTDLCALASHTARIAFISSVATTGNWSRINTGTDRGAPEALIDDPNVPLEQGYAESKYVSEHLLARAARAGIPATICRVGQVAGPALSERGLWNMHEWVPSLLRSSSFLRALPESLGSKRGNIDWVPVDLMAKAVVELCGHGLEGQRAGRKAELDVFNLVNSRAVDWSELVPAVMGFMPDGTEVVSYKEWLAKLEESNRADGVDASVNPATKLMDFWEALGDGGHPTGLVTEKTCGASKTMRDIGPINAAWMENWMRQWGFHGSDGT